MKRTIQLNPFNPPLHPMLQTFKKKCGRSLEKDMNAEELNFFHQQLSQYIGIHDYRIIGLGSAYDILPGFISQSTTFLNVSAKFQNLPLSTSPAKINCFIQAIDFSTGKLFSENLPAASLLIDISGLMPYSDANGFNNRYLMLRLNDSIGVDLDWIVLLEKGNSQSNVILPLSSDKTKAIRLMNFIFDDYSLQKNLTIRDYKYKAALLENLISSHQRLNYYLKAPKDRSKTVFSLQATTVSATDFKERLFEKGFETGINRDKNGNEFILISNFINHSKEQIEAFVDTVNEII